MNIVTFEEPLGLGFRKSSGGIHQTFEAGRQYLVANQQMANLVRDSRVQNLMYRVSLADPRIPNFHIAALKPRQRVLLYNASGGFGDQILTMPVAKYLSDAGAAVHILTEPGNDSCWWNLPFIKSVVTIPLLLETTQLFDHFVYYPAVINMDEHQDQLHPVDAMLAKIGVDPASVSDDRKAVKPVFTASELGTVAQVRGRRIGLYQLSCANPVRSLPPGDSAHILCMVAKQTPDIHWLALHDEYVPKEYTDILAQEVAKRGLSNVEPSTSKNLRELWALAQYAEIVVAPDSMMVHVAGVFGTPCVGLWGPVDPHNRVRYYKNHKAVFKKETCPHAPCFVYSQSFPKYCPPRANRKVCDVLASISPTEVVDAINEVLS